MKVRVSINMQSSVDVEVTEARYKKLQDLSPDVLQAKQALLEEFGERVIVDGIHSVYVDDAVKIQKLPKARRARKA